MGKEWSKNGIDLFDLFFFAFLFVDVLIRFADLHALKCTKQFIIGYGSDFMPSCYDNISQCYQK